MICEHSYNLLNFFNQKENAYMMQTRKKFTHSEEILLLLASAPDQCLTFNEIHTRLNMNKKTLYTYLNRLEKRGAIFSVLKQEKSNEKIYCLNY
mgnify:CR=1 FL=1